MKTALTEASKQLFARKNDESYPSLESVLKALETRTNQCRYARFEHKAIEFSHTNDKILLNGNRLNHHSFSQVCTLGKIPKDFLNSLPIDTATRVLNDRKRYYQDGVAEGLIQVDSNTNNPLLRGIFSESYAKVSDLDIARITAIEAKGFGFVPGGHLAGKTGHGISASQAAAYGIRQSSGLYVGEQDMFLFLISPQKLDVKGEELYIGFFVSNSETRDGCLTLTTYACDGVCANHIIWGASNVSNFRWVHRGDPKKVLFKFRVALENHLKSGIGNESWDELIRKAKETVFDIDVDHAIDRLKAFKVPESIAMQAINYAGNRFGNDDKLRVWPIVSGLTFASQSRFNQDERSDIDLIASKVLATVSKN